MAKEGVPRKGGKGGWLKSGGTVSPGRPKRIPEIEELMSEVLGGEGVENSRIKRIMDAIAQRAERGDVRAAELLLDRAYGKAQAHLDLTSKGEAISLPMIKFIKSDANDGESE